MLSLPLEQRFSYDADQNVFFINFERLAVRSVEDIERIRRAIEARLAPLGKKVFGIVNYESFTITPELTDAFGEMVQQLVDHFYYGVTRYTTSSFLRLKLGEALAAAPCRPAHLRKRRGGARAPAGDGTEGRDGSTVSQPRRGVARRIRVESRQ
jgi:propionate CoA-transferase